MYFLYVMKDKGLPVGEIFEKEIKDIPTSRFSKNLDETGKDPQSDEHKGFAPGMNISDFIFNI